ncbi:hypothetical protein FHW69_001633 [Luteibacter sp. Sphag1AF]|uniref:hypothetical protein n=1 Tax=Luteibacter sp. Sphag1AF TaxID=2587031 RepID=UPI00161C55FC|nr:hypothetical protein [Luteibacter sp. Sphag1AF]MBB3227032.1 hypothetical protein [Luteibacter sp. Sphag1AF]
MKHCAVSRDERSYLADIDEQERRDDHLYHLSGELIADDESFADGLVDALYTPGIRENVIALFRNNDLMAAAKLMADHVPTYCNERAEVIVSEKEKAA